MFDKMLRVVMNLELLLLNASLQFLLILLRVNPLEHGFRIF